MTDWLRSIDPAASKLHWMATWRDSHLFEVDSIHPDSNSLRSGGIVVVEDQFVTPMIAKSACKLAKAAGHLVGYVLGRRLDEVAWVAPHVWKKGLCRCKADKPKTGGIKAIDKYQVHLANLEILGEDERAIYGKALKGLGLQRAMDCADAVGLGLFYLNRVRGAQ